MTRLAAAVVRAVAAIAALGAVAAVVRAVAAIAALGAVAAVVRAVAVLGRVAAVVRRGAAVMSPPACRGAALLVPRSRS